MEGEREKERKRKRTKFGPVKDVRTRVGLQKCLAVNHNDDEV